MLHLMLPQMGCGTALVRSTWIVTSRDQGARAMEGQHAVVVPKLDPLVQRLRNASTPQASTGGGFFCTSVQFNIVLLQPLRSAVFACKSAKPGAGL